MSFEPIALHAIPFAYIKTRNRTHKRLLCRSDHPQTFRPRKPRVIKPMKRANRPPAYESTNRLLDSNAAGSRVRCGQSHRALARRGEALGKSADVKGPTLPRYQTRSCRLQMRLNGRHNGRLPVLPPRIAPMGSRSCRGRAFLISRVTGKRSDNRPYLRCRVS